MIIPKIQNTGIKIPGYSLIKSANFPSSAFGHPNIKFIKKLLLFLPSDAEEFTMNYLLMVS